MTAEMSHCTTLCRMAVYYYMTVFSALICDTFEKDSVWWWSRVIAVYCRDYYLFFGCQIASCILFDSVACILFAGWSCL